MKTLLIAFFAFAATLNLFAQTDEPQKQDASAPVAKAEQVGLTLQDNTVWLIENGETKAITEEIWMRNGMQITPSGMLTMANGEKAQLREGDFVSLKGAVARPIPIGTEVATK